MNEAITKALWRIGRGALITAAMQTAVLQPDWSKPDQAMKILSVAFLSGFILAAGKAIREEWGNANPEKGLVNKIPI